MKSLIRFAVIALAAVVTLSILVWPSKAPLQAQPSGFAYLPDLGDLMAATQLRHLKLSFAGNLKNWELANYEVGEIRKSFDAAAKLYPVFQNMPLAKLIADVSEPALNDIDKSIKARDPVAFRHAFKTLTDACNSCHEAAGFGFIAIHVPTSSPFSNQSFVPTQK